MQGMFVEGALKLKFESIESYFQWCDLLEVLIGKFQVEIWNHSDGKIAIFQLKIVLDGRAFKYA